MSGFAVIQGRVEAREEQFDKESVLSGVGITYATLPITLDQPVGSLSRILVVRTGGATETFNVKIYDKNTYTPADLIFEANETEDRLDVCERPVTHFKTANHILYIRITSSTTNGHTFSVRLQGAYAKPS